MPDIEKIAKRFSNEFAYSRAALEKDFMGELSNFDLEKWELFSRAARLSAYVKNYKTSQMLIFVITIVREMNIDATPLVIKRICKLLFGRVGSQRDIVDLFGEEGRVHRSKDAHPDRIEEICQGYVESAKLHFQSTLLNIEEVKRTYRDAVKRDEQKRKSK